MLDKLEFVSLTTITEFLPTRDVGTLANTNRELNDLCKERLYTDLVKKYNMRSNSSSLCGCLCTVDCQECGALHDINTNKCYMACGDCENMYCMDCFPKCDGCKLKYITICDSIICYKCINKYEDLVCPIYKCNECKS